uniref:Protein kinase domain-containing protein n=1 Tax=Amphilophus citrinellus TaxID=61819 RepID=A0A3Q0RCI7_AMPCI
DPSLPEKEKDMMAIEISANSHSGFDCVTLIGKGAFGRVYKARDKLLGKYYAIKVIPSLREAEALSVLDHLNIVRYHACWMGDSGCQSDGTDSSCSSSQSSSGSSTMFLYIQLGLCDTKTLGDWINERNMEKSSPNSKRREESLNIAQQMVRGVEYIHSKKFIHRDLKPSNILFGQDGKVKIGDFSLVTTDNADDDKTPMERTLDKGTPLYMAPEQSGKTYDRKVDIFALGLIYFELLWTIPTYHERGKVCC